MHAARAQKFPQNLCVMESALGNIDGVVLDAINQPITYDPIPRAGLRPAAGGHGQPRRQPLHGGKADRAGPARRGAGEYGGEVIGQAMAAICHGGRFQSRTWRESGINRGSTPAAPKRRST